MTRSRGTQWLLGLVRMMAISSPQYVWTLFIRPMTQALGVSPPAPQVTFSLLIVMQTFCSPVQGWLVERFGPRHATRNHGFPYISQGSGSIFRGPMAALPHDASGGWTSVFAVAICADFLAAILAIAALKPMRRAYPANPRS